MKLARSLALHLDVVGSVTTVTIRPGDVVDLHQIVGYVDTQPVTLADAVGTHVDAFELLPAPESIEDALPAPVAAAPDTHEGSLAARPARPRASARPPVTEKE